MKNRRLAIILESIPLVSAPLSFFLVTSKSDSTFISWTITVAFFFAFFGFAFFLVLRRFFKGDKVIKILGILDCVATLYVIVFYALAIISFGL